MEELRYQEEDGTNEYRLDTVKCSDMPAVLRLRQDRMAMLRTPYLLTEEMQAKFYDDVICNPYSGGRFWSVRMTEDHRDVSFAGLVGFVNIQWENRTGEISCLLFNPREEMVADLVRVGFQELNFYTITGEVYECSPDFEFWKELLTRRKIPMIRHNDRKFWHGEWYDSYWFSIIAPWSVTPESFA